MSHAAQVRGDTRRPHAPARHLATSRASIGWPLVLAVLYGCWGATLQRDAGPITWRNVLFGIGSGLVVGVVAFVLHKAMTRAIPQPVRAAVWGVFAGAVFGYLYSLSGASILRSIFLGLVLGLVVLVSVFYRYHTKE
ncbi:COX20 family protein [Streptomyces sp. SID8014]|uniref:COX20 family protein n=1 Tax=Streptomyces sp. SID8014 TaxID=2706097 RepID=UPI0013BB9609|nr:COX20 family protein [Streptomyces sp. SID8014]NEC13295.1 COX20 family protein [Streptomyces sp. SID8014]